MKNKLIDYPIALITIIYRVIRYGPKRAQEITDKELRDVRRELFNLKWRNRK